MGNSLDLFRFIVPAIRRAIAHAVLAGTNNYAREQVLWLTYLMPHAVENVKGACESSLVVGLLQVLASFHFFESKKLTHSVYSHMFLVLIRLINFINIFQKASFAEVLNL